MYYNNMSKKSSVRATMQRTSFPSNLPSNTKNVNNDVTGTHQVNNTKPRHTNEHYNNEKSDIVRIYDCKQKNACSIHNNVNNLKNNSQNSNNGSTDCNKEFHSHPPFTPCIPPAFFPPQNFKPPSLFFHHPSSMSFQPPFVHDSSRLPAKSFDSSINNDVVLNKNTHNKNSNNQMNNKISHAFPPTERFNINPSNCYPVVDNKNTCKSSSIAGNNNNNNNLSNSIENNTTPYNSTIYNNKNLSNSIENNTTPYNSTIFNNTIFNNNNNIYNNNTYNNIITNTNVLSNNNHFYSQLDHNTFTAIYVPNTFLCKDTGWLTLDVCREYTKNRCTRTSSQCRYAHPTGNVEIQNGKVTCCFDSIKGKCQRREPPCKYLHPPQHLKEQLLHNGRQQLFFKHQQACNPQLLTAFYPMLYDISPYKAYNTFYPVTTSATTTSDITQQQMSQQLQQLQLSQQKLFVPQHLDLQQQPANLNLQYLPQVQLVLQPPSFTSHPV